ncbi:50S ribosomal protein L14e [Candidatus Woesearchaeota archaeon]|nr:MAG: 50S ribosomal protein L14e [Candidatus Woesearchaeota archaeon]
MFDIGRMVVKIAGRDAGKKAVIVEVVNEHYVVVDGETRRRKCNVKHLEPLEQTVDLKKNASHEEITKLFASMNLTAWKTKPKPKTEKPKKVRKTVEEANTEKKADKKEIKKSAKKTAK